jgi:hypothetical protein
MPRFERKKLLKKFQEIKAKHVPIDGGSPVAKPDDAEFILKTTRNSTGFTAPPRSSTCRPNAHSRNRQGNSSRSPSADRR